MKSWTEALGQEIRSGAVWVVRAEVEHNPETGAKRPFEVVKTLNDGRKFREASFAKEASAIAKANAANDFFRARGVYRPA